MTQYIYDFEEGKGIGKKLLGDKGSNMADMVALGLPVPPGFTITTVVCDKFYKLGKKYPSGLGKEIDAHIAILEKKLGKRFGDKKDPLLVSVRSGAEISLPGMMDTILNLGLNDDAVQGLADKTHNERFAWDSYRRLVQMFGNVVMGVSLDKFEHILAEQKLSQKVKDDTQLVTGDLKAVVAAYKELLKVETKKEFPQDPKKQLELAIGAVFGSWNNPRAIAYRRLNEIKGLLGTGVNVQAMVFGNMGETSGTGVAFSRNPNSGENHIYGEFLMNAQGEDIVSGVRTPQHIESLKKTNKQAYDTFCSLAKKLEKHYKDMQETEFTIQEGKLYVLQTKSGKRTATATIKIAIDMVKDKMITKKEALLHIDPKKLDRILHACLDQTAKQSAELLAKGLPASPGAAVGEVVFTAEHAKLRAEKGKRVILVRTETSPEDIEGMHAAEGILTSRGGMTSHAAVVARGMGKCCIAGCDDIAVYESQKYFKAGNVTIKEGDMITLEGNTGEVYKGELPVAEPMLSKDFEKIMGWADEFRKLSVRANADIPHDAALALKFGAEGIGLCRTEHMFFDPKRIKAIREMIVADTVEQRKKALAKLLPFQIEDFLGLFKVMGKRPVTIRLLDPPLHEFLPKEEQDIIAIAKEIDVPIEKLKSRVNDLHEINPMLGHRGCRLGIVYPEITEMQATAIFTAALQTGAVPEIMIPLVGHVKEFRHQKSIIDRIAQNIMKGKPYKVGTMIEVPRAALTADEIAQDAEFFSFGTNDLTQMGAGFSRDDAAKFLTHYVELGIYEQDPFETLDQKGIGELMKICVSKGRQTRPGMSMGICGEHGGDPESVKFSHKIGLSYVSCSPFRVPIARLAAAQAALEEKR